VDSTARVQEAKREGKGRGGEEQGKGAGRYGYSGKKRRNGGRARATFRWGRREGGREGEREERWD